MATRVFRAARWALLLSLLCLLGKALPAQQKLTTEDAIHKSLETAKDVDIDEIPLLDVADRLGKIYQVRIVADVEVLGERWSETSRLFTLKATDIRLRSALNQILRQHELSWIASDDCVFITTVENADQHFVRKIYPVHDLIRDKHGEGVPDDFDELLTVIKSTIEPQSWPPVAPREANKHDAPMAGLAASRATGTIVVWHNRQVHEQIDDLLRDLQAAKQAHNSVTTSK